MTTPLVHMAPVAIVLAVGIAVPATGALGQTASPVTSPSGDDALPSAVDRALQFAARQLDLAARSISASRYPSTTGSSGAWSTTGANAWTSGFFPGCLWLMYDWSGDPRWRTEAGAWLTDLEAEKNDTSTHNVGFKIFPSFGNAYRLTGNDAQRLVVLAGASSLATRYSPIVGAIRSWNGPTSSDFRVIMDNMMNLEILFWGARHGGKPAWTDMAVSHALTTLQNHVRSDGSTYQLVNFDPATGKVKEKGTHQGHDAESTWSRGQAWAVYGFTVCYRETGDPRFLDAARRTAQYFIAHLPPDRVPYWDFELPSTRGEPRDSSAAAVAAGGLLELARIEADPQGSATWLDAAGGILTSLTSPAYLAGETGSAAVLLHGTQNRPAGSYDTGLIYGDYYFVEALLRYQRWFDVVPSAADAAAETQAGKPVEVTLSATDAQECDLLFSIVDPPAHGSLGPLAADACVPGTPNRDGARAVYSPAAGFTGTDTFTYRASDGTHDSDLARVTITVRPGGGSASTFTAGAASKVQSSSPSRNYGTETTLRVRAPSPEWRTYLKFTVNGIGGKVGGAKVRLYVTEGSNDAGRIFAVGSTWTETGITWKNAPRIAGNALGAGGPVAAGEWVEFDVTPAVTGNGTFSFALVSSSTDSASFSSRRGKQPPELVLTMSGSP